MRRGLVLLALLSWSRAATSTVLELPQAARWMLAAPTAQSFAEEYTALARVAGKRSRSLEPAALGGRLQALAGLPLLSASGLSAAGVETSRSWLLFRRAEVTYLAVTVRDERAFVQAMAAWARTRQLGARQEQRTPNGQGRVVTWARSKAARPAVGFGLEAGRAVVLVEPSLTRPHGLENAIEAVFGATPVDVAANGGLVWWFNAPPWGNDVWLGIAAGVDGFRLSGVARTGESGAAVTDAGGGAWVSRLLAGGDDTSLLRVRLLADELVGRSVANRWLELAGVADAGAAVAVGRTGRGRMELRSSRLVPTTRKSAFSLDGMLQALSPALELPGRGGSQADVSRALSRHGSRLRVTREGDVLQLSSGSPPGAPPAEPSGAPTLTCGRGSAVLALHLGSRALGRSLEGVGLLQALGGDVLAELFAARTEFGALLGSLHPLRLLACQEGRRLWLSGRWTF